jgi:methionyl-tRNA formyltransferase
VFLDELNVYGPLDGAVVVAFGQIIPDFLLDFFSGRCVNVHASLLPRWRGAAPIQRALMAGDRETGVCLMKMESGLDTGPVYSQETLSITSTDTLESLHDSLAKIGASLLSRDIPRILRGECAPIPQPEEGVTYAQKITADDALIRWDRTAREIARTVRALWPAPGAYTWVDGKRLKLARVEPREESRDDAPGTVVTADDGRCSVACGEGSLSLEEVQLEGKQRMGIAEFLRGFPLHRGMVLSKRNG